MHQMPRFNTSIKFVAFAKKVQATAYRLLGSERFFWALIGLFLFQALWIALSSRYPQAFDENFHFGLIQLHAGQVVPYFSQHIDHAEVYGAISRDPSYLYHYLFSLPYRLLSIFTDSTAVQVIVLRFINVGLFVWGLFVFRKLFDLLRISGRVRNTVFLFFILTPVVPQLAAQINYDNLIFPLTGLLFLISVRYLLGLRAGRVDSLLLLQLFVTGLFAALVKYTSLPLFVALVGILAWQTFVHIRKIPRATLFIPPKKKIAVAGFALLLLIFGALSFERYAINLARYHSPSPDCAKVLSIEQCSAYSPWVRDHIFAQTLQKPSIVGEAAYPFVWIHRMVFETMFIISSRFETNGIVTYIPAPPLTVANYTAWVIVTMGGLLAVLFRRRLWALENLRLLWAAILVYTLALFLKNVSMYMHSGEAVAIHGRYLVPVYPLLYLILALSFGWFFDRIRRPQMKVWMVIVTLLFFIQGAGLIAWIFRSDPSWYWSRAADAPVYQINRGAQNVIHRVIIP